MNNNREICGDGRLSLNKRITYLWRNIVRNFYTSGEQPPIEKFIKLRQPETTASASPSRVLTEAYLICRLSELLPQRNVCVLDLGCGSGRLCNFLAAHGYSGEYIGIDINDRFDTNDVTGFKRTFIRGNVHEFDPGERRFDLIVSVSALEHIANDEQLIDRLQGMLKPEGLELHFVPSGWGIFIYLWHGYRQYSLSLIGQRFGNTSSIAVPLGGLFSFVLHFLLITMGEMILHLKSRARIPRIYGWLLDLALKSDRLAPVCPAMYAICRRSRTSGYIK
jgi:SAM-dependent methyltransferase